ncbi:MAG: hypothetical protein EOP34_06815 [Rickettsiales bacterium]|nr:MAG: hypothetical protein EOP34_06815 [Rickettsiales bacterium]
MTIKLNLELIFIFLLSSCVYDPQPKGKEIIIHNQTTKQVVILKSLTQADLSLYDTLMINNRRYINRRSNFMTEYGIYEIFYSNTEMNNLKNLKNQITLYIIDPKVLQNNARQVTNNSILSFNIDVDTLNRYDLNHLFITDNKISLEHNYNYTN